MPSKQIEQLLVVIYIIPCEIMALSNVMLDHCHNSYHVVTTSLNKLRRGTTIRQEGVFLNLGFVSFLHVSVTGGTLRCLGFFYSDN